MTAASKRRRRDGFSPTSVVLAGTAVRLAFFFAPQLAHIPAWLEQRPEVSTPISSFRAVKEALYLQHLHVSSGGTLPKPYASGTTYLPPILLFLLQDILPSDDKAAMHVRSALLWTAIDAACALCFAQIYHQKQRYLKRIHTSAEQAQLDITILSGSVFASAGGVACAYLFNPWTLATCLARSTTSINNLAITAALYAAMAGSSLILALASALAVSISLYPALLIPSLSLTHAGARHVSSTTKRKGQQSSWSKAGFVWSLVLTLAVLGGIAYVSFVTAGNDLEWLDRSYMTILTVPDLTPTIGVWWYFFIEIFDHFRSFFLLTFNVHAASYALPFTIKYRTDPMFAVTALVGMLATLKSYPCLGDMALFVSLLSLHREITPYLRHALLSVILFTLSTLLMPALHHLWLNAGSGNANFFYASTLVWTLASGAAVLDAMWAWGRWQWEAQRPATFIAQTGKEDKPVPMVRRVVQT